MREPTAKELRWPLAYKARHLRRNRAREALVWATELTVALVLAWLVTR